MCQIKTGEFMEFQQLTDPLVEWINNSGRQGSIIVIEAAGARWLNSWLVSQAKDQHIK